MTSRAVSSVAGGGPELVGRFTYDVGSGTWWPSDEMFQIYAFAPRSVAPTTELILSHVHPDDLVPNPAPSRRGRLPRSPV